MPTRTRLVIAGTVALVAIAYFALAIIWLHFLRPDVDPLSRPTSEYAVGPYGPLMSSAFVSMSIATIALIIGVHQAQSQRGRFPIGLAMLCIWVAGVLIALTFPIDAEGATPTTAGTVHRTSGPVAFLSLTAGIILLSRSFKHDESWRSLHRPAVFLSILILAGFVATGISLSSGSGLGGLSQRILLSAVVTWYLLAANRLRSIGKVA